MINDSVHHAFQGVLVYQPDRFARKRYDSAIYKARLKKNGVRVMSAKEKIADDASGILFEGVLESMAEYYSVELSQKILPCMRINAEKCLSNGSNPGLGFKVDKDRRFYVDSEEAVIVREVFERYSEGETATDIIDDLNDRSIRTSRGNPFSKKGTQLEVQCGYQMIKRQTRKYGISQNFCNLLDYRIAYDTISHVYSLVFKDTENADFLTYPMAKEILRGQVESPGRDSDCSKSPDHETRILLWSKPCQADGCIPHCFLPREGKLTQFDNPLKLLGVL